MLAYYLKLAWLGARRAPVITALMILAIALGIGVTTTTLTVHHLMSSNPVEHRNDVLYAVTFDNWDPNEPWDEDRPELPPGDVTWIEAGAVLNSDVPDRKTVTRGVAFTLEPGSGVGAKPLMRDGLATTADFFAMFDVPFLHGSAWDARADRDAEPVVVLSKQTNEKVFGGENSVGRTVRLDSRDYRVVGVLDDWRPTPKVYSPSSGAFHEPEDVFVPFSRATQLEMQPNGNVNCWKPEAIGNFRDFLQSDCVWIQAWVELRTPRQVERFQAFMDGHVARQKALGRFPRPLNNRLYRPDAWLERHEVVQDDNRVLLGLSFAFLAVCTLNVVGLLLAKFMGVAGRTALRRALGASRREVFRQHLVEVGAIGLVGGVFGLLLGAAGLAAMRRLYENYENLTQLDFATAGLALALSLAAGVAAGLYPAWRVCRVQPASHLKTQ